MCYTCHLGTSEDEEEEEEDEEDKKGDTTENPKTAASIKGEKVPLSNIESNRLGMGGLKALEKVNSLIKQSDAGQLTDDQERAIERMIIGGLEDDGSASNLALMSVDVK